MTTRQSNHVADVTRARLLEAAIAAFAAKGFHGTTTRDICSAVGMSPAALYVYHKSKEELLYLITRSGHENILRLVDEAVATSGEPTEVLRKIIHGFAIQHATGPAAARVTNYELPALTPEHYAEIREMRRRIEKELFNIVQAGVAAGDFDTPDPQMATVALLSLGIDIGRWYRDGGRWSPEYTANRYAEMALRIVGARG